MELTQEEYAVLLEICSQTSVKGSGAKRFAELMDKLAMLANKHEE